MSETFTNEIAAKSWTDPVAFALISLLSQKPEIITKDAGPPKEYVVDLKINGVEVSFSDLISRFNSEYSRLVKKAALQLLRDKMGQTMDALYRIERQVETTAHEELGIDWENGR